MLQKTELIYGDSAGLGRSWAKQKRFHPSGDLAAGNVEQRLRPVHAPEEMPLLANNQASETLALLFYTP